MLTPPVDVIGMMSGSSLDGLDVAHCTFSLANGQWQFTIVSAETLPYTQEWTEKLANTHTLSGAALMHLHADYGKHLGNAALSFMSRHGVLPQLVASHGHTVFHKPQLGYSTQIGCGQHLASVCGVPVVSDFRTKDITLGGQGAPLVPIGDKLLFGQYHYCVNLGGIANLSTDIDGARIAYDVCALNFALNHLARQLNLPYDKNGDIARTGSLYQPLLDELNALPYFALPYPKSIANEWIRETVIPLIDQAQCPIPDKLHTLCLQMGQTLGAALGNNRQHKILLTGGGAFNKFLVQQIAMHTEASILVADQTTVNFKEALVFAFLGVLKMKNEVNCLASVTGASANSISGVLYTP